MVTHGAVVSAHPLASLAGRRILQQGGNAIDAAITTQLVLAVVYPNAGNIGGGGFMVAHLNNGKNLTLDFREKAPAKAFKEMYLDSNGNPPNSIKFERTPCSWRTRNNSGFVCGPSLRQTKIYHTHCACHTNG